jgi:hypothetical protein
VEGRSLETETLLASAKSSEVFSWINDKKHYMNKIVFCNERSSKSTYQSWGQHQHEAIGNVTNFRKRKKKKNVESE